VREFKEVENAQQTDYHEIRDPAFVWESEHEIGWDN